MDISCSGYSAAPRRSACVRSASLHGDTLPRRITSEMGRRGLNKRDLRGICNRISRIRQDRFRQYIGVRQHGSGDAERADRKIRLRDIRFADQKIDREVHLLHRSAFVGRHIHGKLSGIRPWFQIGVYEILVDRLISSRASSDSSSDRIERESGRIPVRGKSVGCSGKR